MTFEFDGEKYQRSSSHQKEWGNKIIAGLDLKGDERILDLGCGDGALTGRLAWLVSGGSVLGIDASQGMIDTAGKLRKDNLEFRKMDISLIAFEEEFDLVFSNAALHWIKDHPALLSKVCRSLKPGGTVRFNFAAAGNCANFFRVVKQAMGLGPYKSSFADFEWPWYMPGVAEYRKTVKRFPFRETRVWGENADRYFPDAGAMIAWVDQPSLVPFLKYLDGEKKDRFRATVVERMVKATLQEDGTCFETFRRINLFARK
ncbi:MAG: methyltransferase domain-containing protein [Candidatus Glassbacteria bacterium]|nr:methyltransferase domain-containing protein [Candidatus Glassbacteria bacterium]